MSEIKSNDQQSFAARFASKKSNFTSQSLSSKAVESKSEESQDSDLLKTIAPQAPKKQVNPMKKMQAEQIYLVKGVDAGRNAWYYVLVERLKIQVFLKALNDDIIHLENYGQILFRPMEMSRQLTSPVS